MVTIVGEFHGVSKSGKDFVVLAYNYPKKGVDGLMAESTVMSPNYADMITEAFISGIEVKRGWSKKDNKPFLFIDK